ncbi:MAG: tripartite tricarboxylate transporter substrate binding protein [Acetobacteraceae bacterium]|nr:tripartite tricarboxylate transporter substrate binding protein [Acetobacteraceae bacterium]MDW8397081.1 tripartite tricarboxylate transporter substrate binding protein [Acetobacteraceae bacterium]
MTHLPLPRRALLAAAGAAALPASARAQGWPGGRPIRFIVPGGPAGAADVLARIVTEPMAQRLSAQIVIENRPGATTNIGMALVARAAPDGYTIGLGNIAANAVNRWLFRNMPFDGQRDFTPIGLIAIVPNLIVIPASLPPNTLQEFIAWARARGQEIPYGSVGPGSSQHLAGAQFGMATGLRMTHVPYTQSGQMNIDLMENRLTILFQSSSSVAQLVREGRMKAIAVTGTERLAAFPEVPTMREQGLDIVSMGWFGIVAPAGLPEAIADRLNAALNATLADPGVRERIIATGAVPRPTTRAEFAAWIAEETERWRPVVEATGARLD